MSEETITISKSRYEDLLRNEIFMDCLLEGGVDNWEWYGDACEAYREILKEKGLLDDDDV